MAMGMGFGTQLAGDYGHRLLSLDGPFLYYQTNLGAVAAIEAESGSVRWVATYPRQDSGRTGQGSDRDLNPAIVHEGLVIVAPSDASAIFAFDADSGRLVWQTDPISDEVKLSHLLGVAKGRLVATGNRVLLFDVKTGKLVSTWPDSGKAPEGYGRGLLAGNRIYWPTRNEIQVLDQRSGLRAEPPIKLMEVYRTTGGNLIAGDGYLVVAQSDALVVFCQNSRLIERYRDEIAKAPGQAATYYRLARAAEAVGRINWRWSRMSRQASTRRPPRPSTAFPWPRRRAATSFGCWPGWRPRPGEKASSTKPAAASRPRRGSAGPTPIGSARYLLLSELETEASRPAVAVEILEKLLTDERLRGLTVSTGDGHRAVRADLLIADRLTELVQPQRPQRLRASTTAEPTTCSNAADATTTPACSMRSAASSPWPRLFPTPCWHWAKRTSRVAAWGRPLRPTSGS